jgi:YggT family protein
MHALFWLLDTGISLFVWALIIAAVLSTLLSFGVLDHRNRLVWTVTDFFERLTQPVLRPVRNMLPNLGGIDISAIVVILLLQALRILLGEVEISLLRAGIGI